MQTKKIIHTIAALTMAGFISTSVLAAYQSEVVTDNAITQTVKQKLSNDPTTSSNSIHVHTKDGVVTLSGKVMTDTSASTAVEKAESTKGVKDVDSQLVVSTGQQPMKDSMITAKVKGIFVREKVFGKKEISLANTSVETKNGMVYLSGTVAKKIYATNAVQLAKQIDGVKGVVNQLQVKQSS